MPMLWATMSCISRAMRRRSSVTAWVAARARSVSPYARVRWETSPRSQATTAVSATVSSINVPMPHPHSSRTVSQATRTASAMDRAVTPMRRGGRPR